MRVFTRTAIRCGIGFACIAGGCSREDQIERYTVPRLSQEVMLEATPNTVVEPRTGEQTRMLAAIVPRGARTWFFKLVGPDQSVAEQEDRFRALVTSLRFPEGADSPEFDLPDGWQRLPGSGMRFATLRMGDVEAPMDLTIIPLPTGAGSLDEYLLANINRWREQLKLPPASDLRIPDDTGDIWKLELDDDTSVTAVSLSGTYQGQDMPGDLAGGGLPADHPPIGGGALSELPVPESGELTYTLPDGWALGKAGGMRKLAFDVREGDAAVEITAISLPQSGGDRLENINRWRDQVGLAALSAAELEPALEQIVVDGVTGQFVEIVGAETSPSPETVLGVLVDHGALTWFFKLKGDVALAEREKQRFREFAQSVKFVGEPGSGSIR